MKNILFITILFTSLNIQAQSEGLKTVGLYIAQIGLQATGDALDNNGHYCAGHLCNAASVGTLLVMPYVCKIKRNEWPIRLISYVGIRFALYDYVYNYVRGKPVGYLSKDVYPDKILSHYNPNYIMFGRGAIFLICVSVPIDKL